MIARLTIALLLSLPLIVVGQTDPLVEAYRRYQSGDLAGARQQVEAALAGNHANNGEAWLLQGFINKDLYKGASGEEAEGHRRNALESLARSLALDPQGEHAGSARQAYEFMTRSYYNDAAKALNAMNAELALTHFKGYEDAVLRLDPRAELRDRRVEFNNAIGTVYTKRFNNERERAEQFDLAVKAYEQVLELDASNYGANYNLATLYYNRGVHNIRSIKADDDIPSIQRIQEVGREYFQLALPYMLKAHDMNPSRRETLLGLEGIYYSLQDQENSDRYRQLFEELPIHQDR